MRLTTTLAMTVVAAMTGQAGQTKKIPLTVYVRNSADVPAGVTKQAEALASSMFASIGVKIDWRSGEPDASSSSQALAIRLARNTPKPEMPGALAYALPYEGTHIVVFWDRMECGLAPGVFLAHVMVHEITHVVEGISRHSETGIMKAHWTDEDNKEMMIRPLSFAAEDVELIHHGLAARNSFIGIEVATSRAPATTVWEK
jgi:hypothetical protein